MRLSVSLLSALLGAGPALALDAEQCVAPSGRLNIVEFGHIDLGQGRVLWEAGFGTKDLFQLTFLISDCATGATIAPLVWTEGLDATWKFRAEALALARAEPSLPLSDLAGKLVALGMPRDEFTLTDESCACAAFYPELRGDKPAYAGQ
jgi:hypothetical protein